MTWSLVRYFRNDDLWAPGPLGRWKVERANQRAVRAALEASAPDVVAVWHVPVPLHDRAAVSVEPVQVAAAQVVRHVSEAGDAERPGTDELEIGGGSEPLL